VDSQPFFAEDLPACQFYGLDYLLGPGRNELNITLSKRREFKNDAINGGLLFTETMALFALDHLVQTKIPFIKSSGKIVKFLTSSGIFTLGLGVGSLAMRDPSLTLVVPLDKKFGEQTQETVLSLLAKSREYAERDSLDPDQLAFHLAKLLRQNGQDAKLVRSNENTRP
jgi:hypothetical protein